MNLEKIMAFDLKYLGHSAFEINIDGDVIYIDPFLAANPTYNYKIFNIKNIFLTHGHSDHVGSALDISKKKNVEITAVFELANWCHKRGARVDGVSLGGWLEYDWGRAIFLPAFHSSSNPDGHYAGCAAGILFEIQGIRIFHAGDTCLNTEMKMIAEVYKPEIVMLPIGGHFTMDVDAAVIAADWLNAKKVIPMHYNTFSQIFADVDKFKTLIQNKNRQCIIMQPNDILSY